MSARLAVHLEAHQLPELQRAARCLLRTPLITAATGDEFRLVRRWEQVLRTEFAQKLGYRLDVARNAARLLRRPASLSPHRGARLDSGRTLSRLSYVYLCLSLAAIEQPGHQVLASELVGRIEQSVRGEDRLRIDLTEHSHRRAFRDAIRYLEQFGVLRVRDGDVDGLVADGQVLFDIDRDAAEMCMVASPSILREVTAVADFVVDPPATTIEGRRRAARHRLNRRMIDQPFVSLGDLDVDEAELAWRNRRREADNLARLTGCSIELRREGIALVDHPHQPVGRTSFPATDSIAHAALLFLDRLVDAASPASPDATGGVDVGDGVDAAGGVGAGAADVERCVPGSQVGACWANVMADYGERFAKAAREQPDQFRTQVDSMLESFGLVRFVPTVGDANADAEVRAFAARFRARPEFAEPSPSRSTSASAPSLFSP